MEEFLRFAKENPGKILGGLIGLLVAVIIVIFGFWMGIFIILCILAGILIVARGEAGGGLGNLLEKLWFKRDHY